MLNRRLRQVEEQRRGKKSGLLAAVNAMLLHLAGIQALNRSTRTEQHFGRKARQVRDWGYRYHRLAAMQQALPLFFAQMLLLAALSLGWLLGLSGAALFAAVLVLMSWRQPLARLLRTGLVWKKGLLSLEKLEELLQSPIATEGAGVLPKKGAHTLRFSAVRMFFLEKKIPQGISFCLETGQTLHLEMPTGGGKTTLTKLLAGLYSPDAGLIEWDGLPAAQLSAHSLRRLAAFVSDAFPLVGHNLLDALSPSSQADALAATEQTLRDFQNLFPEVLQNLDFHQKWTGGPTPLSTGQQRLLQCLRAVLADKPFLILDEPLAGLDAGTAGTLRVFLEKNCAEKGVLWLTTGGVKSEE